jgi:hypothetical protein
LDVPITFKLKHKLNDEVSVFAVIGTYTGIAISGKVIAKAKVNGEEIIVEDQFSFGNHKFKDDLNRIDVGMTFGGGVEINSIYIGMIYDYGITNIAVNHNNGTSISNRLLKITLGYVFGKKKIES